MFKPESINCPAFEQLTSKILFQIRFEQPAANVNRYVTIVIFSLSYPPCLVRFLLQYLNPQTVIKCTSSCLSPRVKYRQKELNKNVQGSTWLSNLLFAVNQRNKKP